MFHPRSVILLLFVSGVVTVATEEAAWARLRRHRRVCRYQVPSATKATAEVEQVLEHLGLTGTRVTDAGLEHLKGLTQLRLLALDNLQVTNAGLKHLSGLTQLRILWLRDTQVTDDGAKSLQKALPKCTITR